MTDIKRELTDGERRDISLNGARLLGVYMTDEEYAESCTRVNAARNTPVIALSSAHAFRGGLSGEAWKLAKEYIHRCALNHGLPEITGYYGVAPNGEFLGT